MTTWLKITALSSQEITVGSGAEKAFLTPSQQYIPGSTLRGALAAAWRAKYGDGHPAFRGLFDGAVRFGPLIAANSDVESQSVWKCKYHSDPSEPKYIDDAFACAHCHHEAVEAVCSTCGVSRLTPPIMCGRPAERLKGGIAWPRSNTKNTKVVASTAIHPTRKTALKSSLYAREAHRRRTVFQGHVVGDEELLAKLSELTEVTIGGRQSIMGRATLTRERDEDVLPNDMPDPVVLRTISPTILLDDAGRPSLDLASALAGLDVVHVWGGRMASGGTSGWHAASGTPKPEDVALAPGTVIAIRGAGPDRIADLLRQGLGTRRAEGFGWLEVVPEPWQRPTGPQQKHDDTILARNDWDFGSLTPRERKWLAGWLRESKSWDGAAFESLWQTSTGKNLGQKRTLVSDVLTSTPQVDRAALSSELERI